MAGIRRLLTLDDSDSDSEGISVGGLLGAAMMHGILRAAVAQSTTEIEAGDKVRFDVHDKTMFKLMQKGHGGWVDGMQKVVDKVGVVKRVDSDGDLRIAVHGQTLCFNPKSCSKVEPGEFKEGDIIKVKADASTVKRLQNGHGGWVPTMKKVLGKSGRVVKKFEGGQLRVKFPGGQMWTLSPKACILQPHESDDDDDIDIGGLVGAAMMLNLLRQLADSDDSDSSEAGDYEVGDKVKVEGDVEKLKLQQKGHGGWNPDMAKAAGKEGVVIQVDSDDDLILLVGRKKWAINPKSCTKIQDGSEDGFEVGDKVKIEEDVGKLRKQSSSCGWSDSMAKAAGKVGIVVDVDSDGDLRVLVGKQKWAFSPKSCTKIGSD